MENYSELADKIGDGNVPAFQELYGHNGKELQKQARRYISLLDRYQATFGNGYAGFFSSPGRTEIGGNHTDHNHGRVLAGAVNLDNVGVAAVSSSNVIRIESAGYAVFEVDLSHLEPIRTEQYKSAALVRGICERFQENGFVIGGFNACIDGQVPVGSGLSSSASFEILIGTILNHLYNSGKVDPVKNAVMGQYAENHYFGKPCGLMDQTTCAVGGLVTIDFRDPSAPVIKKVDFDFAATGYALVITDTGGSHADLTHEYAALPADMKAVATQLGAHVLREVNLEQVLEIAPKIREKVGDRAILRALHFQGDNKRVLDQVAALERNDFDTFLDLVVESGYSSFMYNQNIYPVSDIREQGVSLALALSDLVLKGKGAWRVHGGGFAGTIQAFVPHDLTQKYTDTLEHMFGKGSCHILSIRNAGSLKVEL